jgi:hypothetical protein
VTEPAKAVAVFAPAEEGDVVALADVAGLEAGELAAVLAGEVELPLELHAAAPATRQAPTAATRHLEPALIRRDFPVKRTIAPCRLSAVTSEPSSSCRTRRIGRTGRHRDEEDSSRSGPSAARCGGPPLAHRID